MDVPKKNVDFGQRAAERARFVFENVPVDRVLPTSSNLPAEVGQEKVKWQINV